MNIEELSELLRKYLATGAAVVVVLISPGGVEGVATPASPPGSTVVTVQPRAAAGPRTSSPPATATPEPGAESSAEPDSESSTGSSTEPESGSGNGSGSDGESGTGSGSGSDLESGTEPESDTGSSTGSESDTGSSTEPEPAAGSGSDAEPRTNDRTGAGGSDPGDPDAGTTTTPEGNSTAPTTAASPPTGRTGSATPPTGPRTTAPSTDPDPAAGATGADSAGSTEADSAAARFGWGTPDREDDFSGGIAGWSVYDGPGHDDRGRRSPSAVSIAGGVMTLTGDAAGTTGGMAWNPGRKYGRWEVRMRAPAADPSYNAVLLLWPDAENWPVGGEVDFAEMSDGTRRTTELFLHHGAANTQDHAQVRIDATRWHNWAVEWTPEAITAYVDGRQWYRSTDVATFPPGPMHLCVQLDWFPQGEHSTPSTMQVDRVRQYAIAPGPKFAFG